MTEPSSNELARLLVAPPYRFDMGLRRGDGRFFRNWSEAPDLLAERASWLASDPGRYAAVLPEGERLFEEAWEWASELNPEIRRAAALSDASALERCFRLGALWEPDFLLMQPHGDEFRLVAACVCFPSAWSLTEKMGHSLDWIHGAVPQLNRELGGKIHAFLTALRPGMDWERVNWGLAATSERNLHPARGMPRLEANATLSSTWFRVERQALRRLPESGGILFGLRIQVERLSTVCASDAAAATLRGLLETMPDEVAEYKGLARARAALVRELSG
ncbi:MAG: DUF3445 domain-containing protein [Verrucomicrobiales bacterium]|nr:DUF3445 domain-containing protein [Verrucomicrobiales bacterium]